MIGVVIRQGEANILTDAAHSDQIEEGWFDPSWWQTRGLMRRTAPGRGSAWFVGEPPAQWVLRRYLRGGLIRHIVSASYLFTGLPRTRAWREYRILAELANKGLPVPRPVAARVVRQAFWYSAELLIEELPASATLADHLLLAPLPEQSWQAVGAVIRQLHQQGVWHADLNARNILLAEDKTGAYIIDFDRAQYRGNGPLGQTSRWASDNLSRLRRSLDKFVANESTFYFEADDWNALLAGYKT